jgi:hypothetical protein
MLIRVIPVLAAMVLCGAALAAVAGGRDPLADDSERLPDLDQELPSHLEITWDAGCGRPITPTTPHPCSRCLVQVADACSSSVSSWTCRSDLRRKNVRRRRRSQ